MRLEIDGPDEADAMREIAALFSRRIRRVVRKLARAMVSFALHGIGVSGGIAIGRAQLVSHATLEVAHYTIPASKVDAEIARFDHRDQAKCRRSSRALHGAMTSGDVPGEFGAFLDVHWMILNDPTLSRRRRRSSPSSAATPSGR